MTTIPTDAMTTAASSSTSATPSNVAPFDVDAIRPQFPALAREQKGTPIAYLDNAATKHKPQHVIDSVADFYRNHNANVHRGMHLLGREATEMFEQARVTVQRFLNAASDREIIFTGGVTDGLNLVAHACGDSVLQPGDRILLTTMEHHSNIVPWQMIAERTGATVIPCPVTDDGAVDLDAWGELCRTGVRIASMVHASNALGTVNPIADMIRLAKEAGAITVVDAAQSSAHVPIDVEALGCDFLGFTGHKLFGPTGIGVLYGRADRLEAMPPWKGGGEMIESVSFEGTTFAKPPNRFEAGTPNIAGAIGLAAAIDWVTGIDRAGALAHEHALAAYGQEKLAAVDGLRLIGTAPGKAPVFSFLADWGHAYDVGTVLDHLGIAVRTGHHCTEPLMRRFGVTATMRASCSIYNTTAEIDRLVAGLERAKEMLA